MKYLFFALLFFSSVAVQGQGSPTTKATLKLPSPPTQFSADSLTNGTTNKVYTATEKTKLAASLDSLSVNTKLAYKPSYYNNIAALRGVRPDNGTVAITSGYYSANDGGGAMYVYRDTSTAVSDSGAVHTPIVGAGAGRWMLVHNRSINIKMFGARGDGIANDTRAIQNAIDFVCGTTAVEGRSGSVFIPSSSGTYRIGTIVLRAGLELYGEGYASSILEDLPGTGGEACLISGTGFLAKCTLRDFELRGNFVHDKMGIYFDGRGATSDNLRGCTDSRFTNLFIRNFYNHCWWWRGDPNSVFGPMQLSLIENCIIYNHPSVPVAAGARALLFTSQCDQIDIKLCHLYTHGNTGEYAVEISREYYNSATGQYGGYSVGGSVINPPTIIANVKFDITTIYSYGNPEDDARGILLESVNGINFNTSWFENLYRAADIVQGSVAVGFNHCTFLECGASDTIIASHNVQNYVTVTDAFISGALITLPVIPYTGISRIEDKNGIVIPTGTVQSSNLKAFRSGEHGAVVMGNVDQYSAHVTLYQSAGGGSLFYPFRWMTPGGPGNLKLQFGSTFSTIGSESYDSTPLEFVNGKMKTTELTSTQFKLSDLNSAPSSATDTGTAGEIRFTATGIYICVATNTWIRCVGATF